MNEQANLHSVPPWGPEFLTPPSPAVRNKVPMVITAQPPSSCWPVWVAYLAVDPEQWMGALRRTLQGGDVYTEIQEPLPWEEGREGGMLRDGKNCVHLKVMPLGER